MNFIFKVLTNSHLIISKSRFLVFLALKIKNQCNLILRSRFAIKDMSPYKNGEYNLLNHLNSYCNTYFDIGANKGEWSSYVLMLNDGDKTIYLYEPGSAAVDILRNKFKNHYNIHIINKALTDKIEELDFHEEVNAGEMSSLIPNWASETTILRKVKTTTIDEEIKNSGLDKIDFLKIDAEGFDLKVLYGASNSIKERCIDFIQFEYNSPWFNIGSSLSGAYKLLLQNGYAIFLIKENGLYTYNIELYGDFYAFSNFLAVSPTKTSVITELIKGKA
jgi:FkbM family methyltransferase